MAAPSIAALGDRIARPGRLARSDFSRLQPYLYIAPALLVLAIFVYWPILASIFLSFHKWDFLRPTIPFVGLANYEALLASPEFWNSLRVTFVFALASVPVRLILALWLAHLLVHETALHRIVRGVVFAPVITSAVSIAIVWSWLFNTDIGLINAVLVDLGLARVPWLADRDLAIWSVAIVNIWKQLGYDLIIYIAGLQAIPRDYYDAAAIDGAARRHRFRYVTLPLLMPTTLFLLVIAVIDSFQIFTLVNVMTQGGPAWGSDVLVNLLYRTSFVLFDIGTGSALAVLLFLLLLALTALKFGTIGRRTYYEYQ